MIIKVSIDFAKENKNPSSVGDEDLLRFDSKSFFTNAPKVGALDTAKRASAYYAAFIYF